VLRGGFAVYFENQKKPGEGLYVRHNRVLELHSKRYTVITILYSIILNYGVNFKRSSNRISPVVTNLDNCRWPMFCVLVPTACVPKFHFDVCRLYETYQHSHHIMTSAEALFSFASTFVCRHRQRKAFKTEYVTPSRFVSFCLRFRVSCL
jgi:hypothetical protein